MDTAASIKDLLNNTQKKRAAKPVRCHTCKWLLTLNEEDAAAVQEAIYSGEWNATVLINTLKPFGLNVDPGALNYHRKQQHQISAG
jgi:hypothetical protein